MDYLNNKNIESPDLDEIYLDNISFDELCGLDPDNWDFDDAYIDMELDDNGLDDMTFDNANTEDTNLDNIGLGVSPNKNDIESEKYTRPSDGKYFRKWIAENNFEVHLLLNDCDGDFSIIEPPNSHHTINSNDHPTELMDGKLLNEWMSTYYPQINLTPEQCNLIIESLDPYSVFVSHEETLYSIGIDCINMDALKENKEVCIQSTIDTPDEIIEYACRFSHENIEKLTENLARTPYFIIEDYSQCLNSITKCCNEYQKLLDLYKQSRFENWKPVIKEDIPKQQAEQTKEAPIAHRRKKR